MPRHNNSSSLKAYHGSQDDKSPFPSRQRYYDEYDSYRIGSNQQKMHMNHDDFWYYQSESDDHEYPIWYPGPPDSMCGQIPDDSSKNRRADVFEQGYEPSRKDHQEPTHQSRDLQRPWHPRNQDDISIWSTGAEERANILPHLHLHQAARLALKPEAQHFPTYPPRPTNTHHEQHLKLTQEKTPLDPAQSQSHHHTNTNTNTTSHPPQRGPRTHAAAAAAAAAAAEEQVQTPLQEILNNILGKLRDVEEDLETLRLDEFLSLAYLPC